MIKNMIASIKPYLPLRITDVIYDGTNLQIYGPGWNFNTLSAWRICSNDKVVFGCFDKDSQECIAQLKNIEIVDISIQSGFLKIDPVFILSNLQRLEIFSTDTYEPWTFHVEELGVFIATPNEPDAFDMNT